MNLNTSPLELLKFQLKKLKEFNEKILDEQFKVKENKILVSAMNLLMEMTDLKIKEYEEAINLLENNIKKNVSNRLEQN